MVIEAAREGGVITGRNGALILADWPGALHVLLDGPLQQRIERAAEESGIDVERAAKRQKREDQVRADMSIELYGWDPREADALRPHGQHRAHGPRHVRRHHRRGRAGSRPGSAARRRAHRIRRAPDAAARRHRPGRRRSRRRAPGRAPPRWEWPSRAAWTPRRCSRWRPGAGPRPGARRARRLPSLAEDERRAAHEVAAFVGVRVVEVATREGDRPEYRRNGPDRCFHCKDELFARISDEVVVPTRAGGGGLRGERRRRAPPGPPGRAGRGGPPRPTTARRGGDRQGRSAPDRAGARAAVRRQAGGPVPGLAHPPLRGGRPGEAAAGRGRRGGLAPARLRRPAGAPPRRGGAHRAAAGRPAARGRTAAARGRRRRGQSRRDSGSSRSTWRACSPGPSRCRS